LDPEDRQAAGRLLHKFERMLRLRELHARAHAEPGFQEPDPRAEMASLAREFPGALRELDELPIDVIRSRIDELGLAVGGSGALAPWMRAAAAFHRLARGALAAKRWVHRRPLDPSARDAFVAATATMTYGEDARVWADDLAAVARPPRGRVIDLVMLRVAAELGIAEDEARRLLHPSSRARGGRGP